MTVNFPALLPEIWMHIAQYGDIKVCRTLCRVSTVFNTIVQGPQLAKAWEREVYAVIKPGPGFGLLLDLILEGRGNWREVFLAYVVVLRSLTIRQSYNENSSYRISVLTVAKNTIDSLILLEGDFSVAVEDGIEGMRQSQRRTEPPGAFETLFLNLTQLDRQQKEDPEVCYYLSECYFRGIGTKINPQKAFSYALVAARAENEPARCNLGAFYAKGFGVEQNDDEAIAWLKTSTTPQAKFFLGVIMQLEGLDFEAAFHLIEEAAIGGHREAQYVAGLYYLNGYGSYEGDPVVAAIDPVKAFNFFELSAHQGHSEAIFNLGNCYLQGFGTQKCFAKGFACFKLSSRYGSDRFCSTESFFGIEIKEDQLKMWQFLVEGSESGDDNACIALWRISKESEEWDVLYQALIKEDWVKQNSRGRTALAQRLQLGLASSYLGSGR
jgi:TPR repeat protein